MAELLLVDNDERILELTAWFLERAGHHVRTAPSYARARELLAEAPCEVLLADLELGSERGREELPRLAAAGILPTTLVVSGFLDAELEAELLAIPGVVGALAKPVDLNTLEMCVARAARRVGAGDRGPRREFESAHAPEGLAPEAAQSASVEGLPRPAPPHSQLDGEGWVEILPDEPEAGA